jgi:hypothetical protein
MESYISEATYKMLQGEYYAQGRRGEGKIFRYYVSLFKKAPVERLPVESWIQGYIH